MLRPSWYKSLLLTFSSSAVFAGCVVAVEAKPAGPAYTEVVVTQAPPAKKVEAKSVAPGSGYVWIDGHWAWSKGAWVWVAGHWVKARAGYVWVEPQYVEQYGKRLYVEGGWIAEKDVKPGYSAGTS